MAHSPQTLAAIVTVSFFESSELIPSIVVDNLTQQLCIFTCEDLILLQKFGELIISSPKIKTCLQSFSLYNILVSTHHFGWRRYNFRSAEGHARASR